MMDIDNYILIDTFSIVFIFFKSVLSIVLWDCCTPVEFRYM